MRVFSGVVVAVLLAGGTTGARAAPPPAGDVVTIYRCIDAAGRLTLRDTPCGKGQKQETRTMLRPHDAPLSRAPAPAVAAASVRAAQSAVPASPGYQVPARLMYECVPPDGGEPYTSDNDAGNPRWVPFWTLGYPLIGRVPQGGRGGHGGRGTHDGVVRPTPATPVGADLAITNGEVHIGPDGTRLRRPVFAPAAFGAGTWVRDDCHALPQSDACARLSDRRDAIRTRFFNAMPSERDVLRVEERAITARLDNDCGSR